MLIVVFVFGFIVWICCPAMWLWAEFHCTRPARLFFGVLMLVAIAVFSVGFYQIARTGIESSLARDYADTLSSVSQALRADRGDEVIGLIDEFDAEDHFNWNYPKVQELVINLARLATNETKKQP